MESFCESREWYFAMEQLLKMAPDVRNLKERQREWLIEQLDNRGRGSRAALARHLGVRNDAITRMTNLTPGKEDRDITFEDLVGIASFFGLNPPGMEQVIKDTPVDLPRPSDQTLVARQNADVIMTVGEQQKHSEIIPAAALIGEVRDLPVYGVAQGGKGAMVVSSEAVDWIVRPSSLSRVRDGYGIIVVGDSMSPKIDSGDTVLVNPHRAHRSGDTCIFRNHADDGTVLICVKELVRETNDLWYVKQHNPKKTFTLKKSQWQVCHVAVGNLFR
jgi:phage repressor protein C with HTH and peptisase S24 domain